MAGLHAGRGVMCALALLLLALSAPRPAHAVEAFDGTDETIRRAHRLAGKGIVVIKVPKQGHDMRFDIPVIGSQTIKLLKKTGASALAVEAGRAIFLGTDTLIKEADAANLCILAVSPSKEPE